MKTFLFIICLAMTLRESVAEEAAPPAHQEYASEKRAQFKDALTALGRLGIPEGADQTLVREALASAYALSNNYATLARELDRYRKMNPEAGAAANPVADEIKKRREAESPLQKELDRIEAERATKAAGKGDKK